MKGRSWLEPRDHAAEPERSVTHPGSIQRPLADPTLQRSIALMTKRGRPHPAGGREFHARRARIAGWAEISRPSR